MQAPCFRISDKCEKGVEENRRKECGRRTPNQRSRWWPHNVFLWSQNKAHRKLLHFGVIIPNSFSPNRTEVKVKLKEKTIKRNEKQDKHTKVLKDFFSTGCLKREWEGELRSLTSHRCSQELAQRVRAPACPKVVFMKPQDTDIISSDIVISSLFVFLSPKCTIVKNLGVITKVTPQFSTMSALVTIPECPLSLQPKDSE